MQTTLFVLLLASADVPPPTPAVQPTPPQKMIQICTPQGCKLVPASQPLPQAPVVQSTHVSSPPVLLQTQEPPAFAGSCSGGVCRPAASSRPLLRIFRR
jgi:hypothetical protein